MSTAKVIVSPSLYIVVAGNESSLCSSEPVPGFHFDLQCTMLNRHCDLHQLDAALMRAGDLYDLTLEGSSPKILQDDVKAGQAPVGYR